MESDMRTDKEQATDRALQALIIDVREAREAAERVAVQVEALADRRGVSTSRECPR